jgi:hypothetical protein
LASIVLVLALVAGGILLGSFFVRGPLAVDAAGPGLTGGRLGQGRGWGMMGGNEPGSTCGGGSAGRGMMGAGTQGVPCSGGYAAPLPGQAISLDEAKSAVERYLSQSGYQGLEIDEIMEFELNFYALIREKDTRIGAMELVIDRSTGSVGPEMGPNMMWNARYGMMGRRGMMGGYGSSGEMAVSAAQAAEIAQQWLDENFPGRQAGDADAFYGYYTFHFLKDGTVEGMLSVNGSSGDVWYHSWHGAFIQMAEGTDL